MAKNLYIAATEAESGKSLIVLGIMGILLRQVKRVGIFRPIIQKSILSKDKDIDLIARHFDLPFRYEEMYGLTNEDAFNLIQADNIDGLYSGILDKYKKLESKCDFILCEGTDFTGSLKPFELDFNAQMANNLGAPIMTVVNGHEKSVLDIADTVQLVKNVLHREKCQYMGMFINRVANSDLQAVTRYINKLQEDGEINFIMPELETLQRLTIRQISQAIKARRLYGNDDVLDYDVRGFKIGAMNLENILKNTADGVLVITPGDRLDVIATLFMTLLSNNFPKIAGIILSSGVTPPQDFTRLLQGLKRVPVAVCQVETDTYTTAMTISKIKPFLTADNQRRLAIAMGHFEQYIDEEVFRKSIDLNVKSSLMTPIMFEYELFERARSNRKHIVLPEGLDERILRATEILLTRNVVDLTLLGNEDEILSKAASLHLNIKGVNIIDPFDNDLINDYSATYFKLRKDKGMTRERSRELMLDVSYLGTMMVYKGHVDGMVSGAVHTTLQTIRPSFEFVKTKPGFSIVSSCFLMCFEDRVLVYGDCAVNPNPNAEELADIAISSADTARMFGIEPKVAMLSYSTGQSGKGADVEKVREASRIAHERRPDLELEGPIQYDAAIDKTVAKLKMPDSNVAGQATVFIFPDLNTGNNTYKAVQRSSGAVAVGPVSQGLNKPVNDLSRGCLVKDIVNTVLITAIQAQQED